MNAYERTFAQLRGAPVDQLPVAPLLMVFAADHVGARYSDYVRDHRALVRAQLAVCEDYELDLVSCCSDAWREAADCGTPLEFPEHQPPHAAARRLTSPADLAALPPPDPLGGGRMTDRVAAVEAFATAVKGRVPILGWIEGPLALAANLYGLNEFLIATRRDPAFAAALLDWCAALGERFALAQVAAGADLIGIGDAAASLVSPAYYEREVAPRERRLVVAIHAAGAAVRLHICGDLHGKFAAAAATGADLIDVDFPQTLAEVRAAVGPDVCLAGNLHPVEQVLHSDPERIRRDLATCHRQAGPRYVVAAGCEVPPGTPPANLRALVEYVRFAA